MTGTDNSTIKITRRPRKRSAAANRRAREEVLAARATPADLPEGFEEWYASYQPRGAQGQDVALLKAVVLDALRATSSIRGLKSMKLRVSQATAVAAWTMQMRGPMDAPSIFTHHNIEAFCREGMGEVSDKSRADYRSRLLPIAHALHPEDAPAPSEILRRKSIRPPYTADELAIIRRVILIQPTPELVRQLCVCVGLGVGAGIDSSDLKLLRVSDVTIERDGAVRIDVPGKNSRRVWVRRAWEDIAARGLQGRPVGALLLGEKPTRDNIAAPIFARASFGSDVPPLSQARFRSTWLVDHLSSHTPFALMCAAAGLGSTRTLFDLLPYVETTEGVDGKEDLR